MTTMERMASLHLPVSDYERIMRYGDEKSVFNAKLRKSCNQILQAITASLPKEWKKEALSGKEVKLPLGVFLKANGKTLFLATKPDGYPVKCRAILMPNMTLSRIRDFADLVAQGFLFLLNHQIEGRQGEIS
jgi:hypothetical protein